MSSVWLTLALIYMYRFIDLYAVGWSERRILPETVRTKLQRFAYPVFGTALGVFTLITSLSGYFSCAEKARNADARYEIWAQTLETLDGNDSVYIVVKDDIDLSEYVKQYLSMRFMATPIQTSGYLEGGNYAEGRDVDVWWTGNPFSMELSFDSVVAEMQKYTHVYLNDVWDGFCEKYGMLFEDPIEDDTLYEIVGREGQMKLIKV